MEQLFYAYDEVNAEGGAFAWRKITVLAIENVALPRRMLYADKMWYPNMIVTDTLRKIGDSLST